MAELQECITDDSWKQSLQSEIITALTESGQTQNHALEQVGYYYQCCAPAFLYKYYRDQPLNLNSVMTHSTVILQSTNKPFLITYYLLFPVAKRFAKVVLHGFSSKAIYINKLRF